MKKFLTVAVAALTLLFCAGCGFFTPPSNGPGLPSPPGGGGGEESSGGGTSSEEGNAFTVKLVYTVNVAGEDVLTPYHPTSAITARWKGTEGDIYSAPFNPNGVATCEGPDGEYQVTLDHVPTGYTYDCNGYYANNFNKEITVELLTILEIEQTKPLTINGLGVVRCNVFGGLGTYRATITSKDEGIWYMYYPSYSGKLSIQSWVDISANEINPRVDIHNGNIAFIGDIPSMSMDGGGASSTFTKNFKITTEISDREQGNVVIFHLFADIREGMSYPVTVDFTTKKEGEVEDIDPQKEEAVANGPFDMSIDREKNPSDPPAAPGTWRYAYEDTDNILRSEYDNGKPRFGRDPETGFWRRLREDGSFGEVLYARLGSDTEAFGTNSRDGFMDAELSIQNVGGKNYNNFLGKSVMDPAGVDMWNFSLIPTENFYSKHLDANGAHPLNDELKEFLQAYATSNELFKDGEGYAETFGGLRSSEENMWLFAVGYYPA